MLEPSRSSGTYTAPSPESQLRGSQGPRIHSELVVCVPRTQLPPGEVLWLEREDPQDCKGMRGQNGSCSLGLVDTMFPSLFIKVLRNLSLPEARHGPRLWGPVMYLP